MTTISIAKAIRSLLNTESIKEKVGNKIFPLVAKIDTTFPYIVFSRQGEVSYTKDSKFKFEDEITVEIIIAHDNYDKGVEIAELIRESLECKKNENIEGFDIRQIRLVGINETFNDCYVQSLTFQLKISLK